MRLHDSRLTLLRTSDKIGLRQRTAIYTILILATQLSCDARDVPASSKKRTAPATQGNVQAPSQERTPAAIREKWKPWAIVAQSALHDIDVDAAALNDLDKKLEAMGPHPWENVESRRARQFPNVNFDLYRKRATIEWRIRNNVLKLWVTTGYRANITQVSPGALGTSAESICMNYRKWLEVHGEQDLEVVVRAELPKNIDAIRTRYSLAALRVLSHWVNFTGDYRDYIMLPMTSNGDSAVTPASQEAACSAMNKWYDAAKQTLVWNSTLQKFCKNGEEEFNYPIHDLVFDLGPTLIEAK